LRLLGLGLGLGLGLANFSLGLGLGGHTVDVGVLFILNIFIMRSPVGPMEGEIINLKSPSVVGGSIPYRNYLGISPLLEPSCPTGTP